MSTNDSAGHDASSPATDDVSASLAGSGHHDSPGRPAAGIRFAMMLRDCAWQKVREHIKRGRQDGITGGSRNLGSDLDTDH